MGNGFEEQAYEAACAIMGEAVWHLVASRKAVSREAIAGMILKLSDRRVDLVASIALSVFLQP